MTFILVQHLDPTHESMMLDLLAGHTSSMLVLQAIDGMPAFAAPEDRIMIARVPRVESKTLVTRAGRTTERVLPPLPCTPAIYRAALETGVMDGVVFN